MVTVGSLENISIRQRTWKKTGVRSALVGILDALALGAGMPGDPTRKFASKDRVGGIFQTIWATQNCGPRIGTLSQGRFVMEAHSDTAAGREGLIRYTKITSACQHHSGGSESSTCGSHQTDTWGRC